MITVFSYKPLMLQLMLRGIKKADLQKELSLSPTTIAKIKKNKYLSMEILDRICTYLDCEINEVIQHIKPSVNKRPKVSLMKPVKVMLLDKIRMNSQENNP